MEERDKTKSKAPINSIFEEKYLGIVKKIVLEETKPYRCTVVFFGSRARRSFNRSSDIDIGILGLPPDSFARLRYRIAEKMEASIVPYRFDLVALDRAPSPLREQAMQDAQIWKES